MSEGRCVTLFSLDHPPAQCTLHTRRCAVIQILAAIGVGDGGQGGAVAPQIRDKKYFSGKHHVIFGQLILLLEEGRTGTLYFWTVLFFVSCVRGM